MIRSKEALEQNINTQNMTQKEKFKIQMKTGRVAPVLSVILDTRGKSIA